MNIVEFSRQANYMLLGATNAVKKDLRPGHTFMEPDYLTAIVTKFPLLMNSTWGNVNFGGCFIHKSPYVSFKKGGCCEAGDMLVLCRKAEKNGYRYNATLFQLKRLDRDSYRVTKSNELVQYELYTEWPEFSLGSKFNPAQVRNINPKTVTPGAQYMLINAPDGYVRDYWWEEYCLHHPCIFTHTIPESVMQSRADLTFGRFLWDFIHWQNGRPISSEEMAANDEWSHFIWDLIRQTRNVMIQNINVGVHRNNGIAKQQGDFFQLLTTKNSMSYIPQSYIDWANGDNDGGDSSLEEDVNEEVNGAISILFIDLA